MPAGGPKLPIHFRAMTNTRDGDLVGRNRHDDSIVPYSKPKIPLPLTGKRFEVPLTGLDEFRKPEEDSHCSLTINRTQIGLGRVGPIKLHRIPNSRRMSACGVIDAERTSS